MVSMRFEEARALLDQYIGPTDPTDPKARRRVKILRAASELFAAAGYRKTSVEEVAERAGVAKGTVYLYFQTKLELLIAAISLEKREHFEQFRPFFDDSLPAGERLRHWIRSALLMGARMPIVSRLLQGGEILALYDDFVAGSKSIGQVRSGTLAFASISNVPSVLALCTSTRPVAPMPGGRCSG